MMKKRIGNDIQFTWHIYRKDGDTQVPESFDGKDVEVKLISPLKQPVTIEDVTIATGVVTFTFRGKHQVTLGNYVAILQENRGEDGMATLDVVNAVTLVAHSYMEEDGEEGDVIEAESVELTSTISAGGGAPIDAYTKAETDALLAKKANSEYADEHKGMTRNNETTEFYNFDLLWRAYLGSWGLTLSRGANTGVIIYDGKLKVNDEAVAMASDLAGKQDTISDLDSIRSGAAAGATAVQPADLTPIDDRLDDVEYCLGDYIKEIYTFNKDNKPEVTTEPVYTTQTLYTTVIAGSSPITCNCKLSAGGQSFSALWLSRLYDRTDPGRIVFTKSGKATIYLVLNTTLYPAPSPYDVYLNVYDALDNVVMTVYFRDLVYNYSRICTAFTCDVANGYYIKVLYGDSQHAVWLGQIDLEINEVKQISTDVHANSNAIAAIEQKIPAQASSSNQLADKDFVNSSIATATATYRGSYNIVSDLSLSVSATQQQIAEALSTKMEALSITPDNNDYCFVQIPTADATPTEIARIDRYKYDGTAWAYEYSLNNSSFTAAQWAALNSGITSGLVAKLSALPTNSELITLLAGKANTGDLAPVATSGNYNDLTGKPAVDNTPTSDSDNLVKSGGVYKEIAEIKDSLSTPINPGNTFPTGLGSSSGTYYNGASHYALPVNEGEQYFIKYNYDFRYALASNHDDYSDGATIPVVSGTTVKRFTSNGSLSITIPAGCTYLLLSNTGYNTVGKLENISDTINQINSVNTYTITQGYYNINSSSNRTIDNGRANRVKINYFKSSLYFHIKLNEGYLIRAIILFDENGQNGETIVSADQKLTEFTFIPKNNEKEWVHITICNTSDSTIRPSEDIVDEFTIVGIAEQVRQNTLNMGNIPMPAISKAVFMGDSITHGVYSYFNEEIHDDAHRYNGFDISPTSSVEAATAYQGIHYYFSKYACCECINLAKRGSGYVQDGRNLGNALEVANDYDFSETDFVALCFGINDYINAIPIGSIETFAENTVIGNMAAVIQKILTDNPLCKIVAYSPYNSWGQYSNGGDYESDTLYGNEQTNYALGYNKGGGTLQDYVDAIDAVCQYYGIQHVVLSKSNVVNRLTIKEIMIDGLHPSKVSYPKLAAEIYGKGNFGA